MSDKKEYWADATFKIRAENKTEAESIAYRIFPSSLFGDAKLVSIEIENPPDENCTSSNEGIWGHGPCTT